jgi:hypothetical protein
VVKVTTDEDKKASEFQKRQQKKLRKGLIGNIDALKKKAGKKKDAPKPPDKKRRLFSSENADDVQDADNFANMSDDLEHADSSVHNFKTENAEFQETSRASSWGSSGGQRYLFRPRRLALRGGAKSAIFGGRTQRLFTPIMLGTGIVETKTAYAKYLAAKKKGELNVRWVMC